MCSLAGWYDNPIPTQFLAPIDCLKITAQDMQLAGMQVQLLNAVRVYLRIALMKTCSILFTKESDLLGIFKL